jgi:hypothetical protein
MAMTRLNNPTKVSIQDVMSIPVHAEHLNFGIGRDLVFNLVKRKQKQKNDEMTSKINVLFSFFVCICVYGPISLSNMKTKKNDVVQNEIL